MAAVFALSLVPVQTWADPTTGTLATQDGTIEVTNPQTDSEGSTVSTYNAYRVLDLASFSDGNVATDKHADDAYSYVLRAEDDASTTSKTENAWLAFFTTGDGATYFDVDQNNPVTIGGVKYYTVKPKEVFKNAWSDTALELKDETDTTEWRSTSTVQQFAQKALAYAQNTSSNVTADATSNTIASEKVTMSNLPLGYYLVSTTTGSLVALDTTNKTASILDKNTVPSIDKNVQEDSLVEAANATTPDSADNGDMVTGYQDVDDANIGQTVHYLTQIRVEKGAQNYVLHDWMDDGLTFDGVSSVKVY